MTAAAIEFSASSEIEPQGSMQWDAVVQNGPINHPEAQHPSLQSGATMTMYIPHPVNGPIPDTVEIVAGVWSDGETFGNSEQIKRILDMRASFAAAYEEAIALLQKGLAASWARDQYLRALSSSPRSITNDTIRRNLEAHPDWDQNPKLLQSGLKNLLEYFSEALSQIRSAKP